MPPSPLKMARIQADLTLYDLKVKTGISDASLSRIERGIQDPTPENKKRIAAALGVPEGLLWAVSPSVNGRRRRRRAA